MRSKNPVVPAILTNLKQEFERKLEFAATVGQSVHIDYIDGRFVPDATLPIEQWPHIVLEYSEVHMMSRDPLPKLTLLKQKNIKRVIIHVESSFDMVEMANKARELDLLLGFTINPDTDLLKLRPVYPISNFIQVMGVHPGRIGQLFIPETLSAITYLKRLHSLRLIVSVDGGVSRDNIAQINSSGADHFISSKAIYRNNNWTKNFKALMKEIENDG